MRKGDCFEASYRHLSELHDEGERDLRLCHGIATSRKGTFCHAWVEKNNGKHIYEFDMTNRWFLPLLRKEYYRILAVKNVVRYTVKRASIESLRHGHFGPWHASFA